MAVTTYDGSAMEDRVIARASNCPGSSGLQLLFIATNICTLFRGNCSGILCVDIYTDIAMHATKVWLASL